MENKTSPPTLIVAGISLTGKSSLVRGLMTDNNAPVKFTEGDTLHVPASLEKMRKGQPLEEADRTEWRQKICDLIAHPPADRLQVITCSALTRAFRDELRGAGPVRFVFLIMGRASAKRRAAQRLRHEPKHYFQPAKFPALLEGQFRDLQKPGPEETDCLVVNLNAYPSGPDGPLVPLEALTQRVRDFLGEAD